MGLVGGEFAIDFLEVFADESMVRIDLEGAFEVSPCFCEFSEFG
jgi:hypothetical protein